MYKLIIPFLIGSVMANLESFTCDKEGYVDLLIDEVIIDAQSLIVKQQTAILTNQRILFLDNDYIEVFESVTLPTDGNADWYKLVQNDDGSFLYAVGNVTNGTQLLASAKCGETGCSNFGQAQILPGIKTKILDWEYVENSLLTLTNQQLVFFNLTSSTDYFIVKATKYALDTNFFGYNWQTPLRFDVQQFFADGAKNYKVFIAANQYGFWVDCAVRGKQLIPYVNGEINFFQQQFNYDYISDCKFIKSAVDNGTHISSIIQLISGGSTSPILEITYTSFQMVGYQVKTSLAQFRDWKAVTNTLNSYNNSVSLIFTNSKGTSAIAFYDITGVESLQGLGIDVKTYVILPSLDQYVTYVSTYKERHFFNFKSDDNAFTQCTSLSNSLDE